MRKLILNIACTLDGYIAGQRGDLEWLFQDHDYGMKDFLTTIDLLIMGRKTFDFLRSLNSWPYDSLKGHVFSRNLHDNGNDHILWVSDEITSHVKALKKEEGKNIWLLGGGEIARICLNHALIDEMILSIHPLLLGKGIPLFPSGFKSSHWELKKNETFPSGLTQLSYQAK